MADHPIQGLMKTAMENLKEMIDVNTIIGDPVETPDGSVILTVSKVDSIRRRRKRVWRKAGRKEIGRR